VSLKNSINKVLMEIGFWNYAKEIFPIKFQSILWYLTTLVALTLIILFSSIFKFSKTIYKITRKILYLQEYFICRNENLKIN
jgi:hypothetical protein